MSKNVRKEERQQKPKTKASKAKAKPKASWKESRGEKIKSTTAKIREKIRSARDAEGWEQFSDSDAAQAIKNKIETTCNDVDRLMKSTHDDAGDEFLAKTWNRQFKHIVSEDPLVAAIYASRCELPKLLARCKEKAVGYYARSHDYFRILLGNLIPSEIRTAARPEIDRIKYLAGSNATAEDDWTGFADLAVTKRQGGFPTGLPGVDEALGGGIDGVTLIGGDEAAGKTSLLLQILLTTLRAMPDVACLFLTTDQTKFMTMQRLACLAVGCNSRTLTQHLRGGKKQDPTLEKSLSEFRESILSRVRFVEQANLRNDATLTSLVIGRLNELQSKAEAKRWFVVMDLFQSFQVFPPEITSDNEKDEYLLRQIETVRVRTRSHLQPDGVPFVVTSEVRKDARQVLTRNDLRGSARLGSAPSNLLLLWPTEDTPQDADVVGRTLRVAKARDGNCGSFRLEFEHAKCLFREVSADHETLPSPCSPKQKSGKLDRKNDL